LILGKCINISKQLDESVAILFAKWIGSSKKKKVAIRKKQHSETNETTLTQKKDRV
tara:strand:+ start:21307 stop:21474 length:168 start_codon:yes stop_codon:yes gene_type:complete